MMISVPPSPASVTVVARSCAEADAWATALMVLGPRAGRDLAARLRLDALFLMREAEGIRPRAIGALFGIVGVLLGGPILVAGYVLVRELYVKDALGHAVKD